MSSSYPWLLKRPLHRTFCCAQDQNTLIEPWVNESRDDLEYLDTGLVEFYEFLNKVGAADRSGGICQVDPRRILRDDDCYLIKVFHTVHVSLQYEYGYVPAGATASGLQVFARLYKHVNRGGILYNFERKCDDYIDVFVDARHTVLAGGRGSGPSHPKMDLFCLDHGTKLCCRLHERRLDERREPPIVVKIGQDTFIRERQTDDELEEEMEHRAVEMGFRPTQTK